MPGKWRHRCSSWDASTTMSAGYNRANPQVHSEGFRLQIHRNEADHNCHQDCLSCSPALSSTSRWDTSNSGEDFDQFPGASVACESALASTCSGGPCEASAPNSASGENKRPKCSN